MQDSLIVNFLDQAWKRVPVLVAVGFIVYFIVWITIGVTNFANRVNATAELTNDIHTKQLPEIRERLTGVETRLTGVETRLNGVETRLTGVETRLTGVETKLTGVETRLSEVEKELKEVVVLLKENAGRHSRNDP
jgi:septal ring factor EnvC (AmiA/AmiB activator)